MSNVLKKKLRETEKLVCTYIPQISVPENVRNVSYSVKEIIINSLAELRKQTRSEFQLQDKYKYTFKPTHIEKLKKNTCRRRKSF